MFDDLDKLENGDNFYIKILNIVLEYEVCQTNIVLPTNTESLVIKEDEDLVTLVTCTPKHVNSHRLLVTGTRVINYNAPIEIKSIKKFNFLWMYGFVFFIIFLVFILNKLKSSKH